MEWFFIGVIFIVFFGAWRKSRKVSKVDKEILEALSTPPEVKIGRSDTPPTYGEILEHYNKYARKFHKRGYWTTDEPMPFEVYREDARRYGWRFLFGTTADLMMGTPFSEGGVSFIDFGG